ncbi:hypothetical protein D1007_23141 [Hordeum vulgare]|nr:hypothetical protein D1007_23141 [Hordeum vulgare]
MSEAEAEFTVAQTEEMTKQHAVLDSIRDETEVEANCRLIWQRQTEADTLFDEIETDIVAKEAAVEQLEGAVAEAPDGAGCQTYIRWRA